MLIGQHLERHRVKCYKRRVQQVVPSNLQQSPLIYLNYQTLPEIRTETSYDLWLYEVECLMRDNVIEYLCDSEQREDNILQRFDSVYMELQKTMRTYCPVLQCFTERQRRCFGVELSFRGPIELSDSEWRDSKNKH